MKDWIGPHNQSGLAALGALLGLLALRWLGLRLLRAGRGSEPGSARGITAKVLYTPSAFWCVALALDLGLRGMTLPDGLHNMLGRVLVGLVITSVTLVLTNLSGVLTDRIMGRKNAQVTGLIRVLVQGQVLVLGLLVLLHSLGIAISPLLTALGVGGLAVALALQDTLSNFFAGLHITVEHPFRLGHFVRLEEGLEGYVSDIGWRTTRLSTRTGNLVVIPNAKIASATLINFDLPARPLRVAFDLGLPLETDPDVAEAVLLDSLNRAIPTVAGASNQTPPDIWLMELAEDRQRWHLRADVNEYAKQEIVLHELRKHVLHGLRAAGLRLAAPRRRMELLTQDEED